MLQSVPVWLLVVALFGAGLANAIGSRTTRASFVHWGYPAWWCHVTGGLEMAAAVAVAVPATRQAGLIIAAVIIATAAVTVLRKRDFSHLVPLVIFATLIGVTELVA